MNELSRRQFLKNLSLGLGVAALPISMTQAAVVRPRVLVIGGGFAGATAAKYLRLWSNNTVDVSLIEPNAIYYSPILSNLVLNGQRQITQLGFKYDTLAQKYGIQILRSTAIALNSASRTVKLANGQTLGYERLILAPGVQFKAITGLNSNKVLHAWKSGNQVQQLRQQLQAMPAGGSFVMSIPKAPYRCPPGPYERACVVADYLKRNKPGSKLIVLDSNPDITVERDTFNHAFTQTYAGIVQYVPNTLLQAVDSIKKVAITSFGDYHADVLNVIPPHQAGSIVKNHGLANSSSGDWANVNPLSYESTAVQGIHIIGDSQGTGQPKAGHIANAEAKICADAVLRLLSGAQPFQAPITNSACYSPISANTASWLTAAFAYDPASQSMQLIPASFGASSGASTSNYRKMFDWANSLFGDTFA
jgi:NADPH-dependent 2,4-dienoyl-CoA reductase/sulfur reductase-like enzyme